MDFEKLTSEQAHYLRSAAKSRGRYSEITQALFALAPGEALVVPADHKLATVKSPMAHLRMPVGMIRAARLADGRLMLIRQALEER